MQLPEGMKTKYLPNRLAGEEKKRNDFFEILRIGCACNKNLGEWPRDGMTSESLMGEHNAAMFDHFVKKNPGVGLPPFVSALLRLLPFLGCLYASLVCIAWLVIGVHILFTFFLYHIHGVWEISSVFISKRKRALSRIPPCVIFSLLLHFFLLAFRNLLSFLRSSSGFPSIEI